MMIILILQIMRLKLKKLNNLSLILQLKSPRPTVTCMTNSTIYLPDRYNVLVLFIL